MVKFKKGYARITFPDRRDALAALERHMKTEEAEYLWVGLCKDLDVEPHTEELCNLEKVYKAMSKKGGKIGVTGSAMLVRLISYKLISKQNKT